jgi:hypothetical protein
MHCLVRDNRLESDTGGQKMAKFIKIEILQSRYVPRVI